MLTSVCGPSCAIIKTPNRYEPRTARGVERCGLRVWHCPHTAAWLKPPVFSAARGSSSGIFLAHGAGQCALLAKRIT
jgi:hypothetical protein